MTLLGSSTSPKTMSLKASVNEILSSKSQRSPAGTTNESENVPLKCCGCAASAAPAMLAAMSSAAAPAKSGRFISPPLPQWGWSDQLPTGRLGSSDPPGNSDLAWPQESCKQSISRQCQFANGVVHERPRATLVSLDDGNSTHDSLGVSLAAGQAILRRV